MGTVHAMNSNMSRNVHETPNNSNERQNLKEHNSKMNLYKKQQGELTDFCSVKARVDRIHVDGLMRTKDDIIKAQVKELFKAQDFNDVVLHAYKVREKLKGLGCFGNIGIYIDTSQGPHATPEGVEVTFIVHEMKRIKAEINTSVGDNEGSVTLQAKAPNLFGRGESLQMEYSRGTKNSTNMSISAVKPFVHNWLHTVLTGNIFNTSNWFPRSGFSQRDKGLLLDIALNPDGAGLLKHNLQYEATYREIIPSKQTSLHVRKQCGPNLKSALRHICSIDKRDSSIFPTMGSLVQFSSEVAGLGGDIGFVKNEFTMQTNWTPHEFITFQLGFQSGWLQGISNDLKINIADQFFLGGPLNLRGFNMRGCGPCTNGNFIGGDAYWAVALHVYTPLPFRPGCNGLGDLFKLHGFINGGNVSNFTFKFAKENMKIFKENVRCAVGGGIAVKVGNIARVELNLIMPLLFDKSDILEQVQFGIGVQYL